MGNEDIWPIGGLYNEDKLKVRARLRRARTSARLAPLADKLLASVAQFTHSILLALNHTRRQAPSAHRSRCSLIQRFWETLLAQNHARTQTGAICPSLSLLAHSPLSGDPTQFTHTESHAHRKASSARRSRYSLIQRSWQTLLISLAQNQTHTESRHLPIAPVAR